MSATQTQVGGSHYKDMKIQPVDYIHANGLGFIEGCVVKYVSRHKSKNGRQDLEKAKHFLELLIEREYPDKVHGINWVDALDPEFRTLRAGETIRATDEVNTAKGWRSVLPGSVGYNVPKILRGLYRRPIKPKEAK